MHLACLGIFFTGFTIAVLTLCITYFFRVFALTAGFHRYFSHRSFKTSRFFQVLVVDFGGTNGPDVVGSPSSPPPSTFGYGRGCAFTGSSRCFWAHVGWVLCRTYGAIRVDRVKDLYKYL